MKVSLFVTTLLFFFSTAAPAFACPEGKSPERKVEFLRERLSLTDDQAQQVSSLIAAARQSCADKEAKAEKRACYREARAASRESIQALLTDEQKAKFQQLREERKERFHKDRKHEAE